jgi:HlyD family secretion protein
VFLESLMTKKWLNAAPAIALVLVLSACNRLEDEPPPEPTLPPVVAASNVRAEARVVPVRSAELSLPAGGRVAVLEVEEGDTVREGQVLLAVDATDQVAAVAQARADLKAAEAALTKTIAGATEEEIRAAEAAVQAAQAQANASGGSVASAQAQLNSLEAGASAEDLAIAQKRIDQAKNDLWGAQNQRDGICGRVGDPGVTQAECDGAEARVGTATEAIAILQLQLDQLRVGATEDEKRSARGALQQSSGSYQSAQALVRQAQAQLDLLRRGATEEDIAQSDARVLQAQAAYDRARAALQDAELVAPFDGTVTGVMTTLGERVSPAVPVIQIADLSELQIETDDLTELSVVRIDEGSPATIQFDALDDLELAGTVERILPFGEDKLGDITYTVVIKPEKQDPRLRWNMTATVEIEPEDER